MDATTEQITKVDVGFFVKDGEGLQITIAHDRIVSTIKIDHRKSGSVEEIGDYVTFGWWDRNDPYYAYGTKTTSTNLLAADLAMLKANAEAEPEHSLKIGDRVVFNGNRKEGTVTRVKGRHDVRVLYDDDTETWTGHYNLKTTDAIKQG